MAFSVVFREGSNHERERGRERERERESFSIVFRRRLQESERDRERGGFLSCVPGKTPTKRERDEMSIKQIYCLGARFWRDLLLKEKRHLGSNNVVPLC